jgi:hypothetical protein
MLDLAELGPTDVLYDLGSGDGRIVIAAARRGVHAIGIELDRDLVLQSRRSAREAGVETRAQFFQQNLFDTALQRATVVTLYLLPGVNMKLRSKLLAELPAGARVISHTFHMGNWAPSRTARVGASRIYVWVVPERGTNSDRSDSRGKKGERASLDTFAR